MERFEEKCQLYADNPELGERRSDLARDARCFRVGNYVALAITGMLRLVVTTTAR